MPSFTRAAKEKAKNAPHSFFVFGQRLGVDILPRHFYSEIPNIQELRSSKTWRVPRSMSGVQGVELGPRLEFVRGCIDESMRKLMVEEKIY